MNRRQKNVIRSRPMALYEFWVQLKLKLNCNIRLHNVIDVIQLRLSVFILISPYLSTKNQVSRSRHKQYRETERLTDSVTQHIVSHIRAS